MKVVIVSPYATVAPHFETELEIAQQHLDAGDEVLFLTCTGQLANCDFNTEKSAEQCQQCSGRREMGLEMLASNATSSAERESNFVQLQDLPGIKTAFAGLQELIDYHIDNFDIGYAALSSLVSVCRDPEPDLVRWGSLLERFITSSWQVYQQSLQFIDQHRPDRIYVFNGRFAAMRAVLRAAEARQIDCFLHERGCDQNHYEIYENHLPHDIDGIDRVIRQLWNNGDPALREGIGASWFHDRVNRVEKSWHSFTKQQQSGLLPSNFSSHRNNLSIFCSSDDEFVAIGDKWQNKIYPNQVIAIRQIAESMLTAQPETHLYLRVHPNLTKVDNARKREMMGLSSPNLTVIAPDAGVDTYALMKASDKTVSFGSSVGIEAVFWDRASVLLGPCLYQHLGGPHMATSHEHAVELMCGELPLGEKTGALMYGHWFQTRGRKHVHYQADSLFEGKFKGQILYDRSIEKKKRGLKKVGDAIVGIFR
jgi:hypothetical protein